jgi:hypothetical protein
MVDPAVAAIPPPDTPAARWARKNIPGADRPGISASELADLCFEEAMRILRNRPPPGEPPPADGGGRRE